MSILTSPAAITLSERFQAGFDQVQDKMMHLLASSPLLLVAALILMLSFWLGGVVSRRMHVVKRISRSNPYLDGLLRNTVRMLIVLAGLLIALDLLGASSLLGAVLGSAGVVGLVLGFAFKDIAENYVAGVLLSLRQPFSPGDAVRIDAWEGKVISLNSRTTILMTTDGSHLQIPNALVFKSVLLNQSRNPQRRFEFQIGVGIAGSFHAAMDQGIGELKAIEGVLAQPAPNALILNLGNDGAILQFTGWIDQTRNDLGRVRSEAIRRVRRRLWEAGIPPVETISKVVLVRTEPALPQLPDNGHVRDTSVDRDLDVQLGQARRLEDGNDFLQPPPQNQLP